MATQTAPAPHDLPVDLSDVQAAAQRIMGAVVRTPTLHSKTLSDLAGADVWLKFENLQFTAAYKERGALNTLLQLVDAARALTERGWLAADARIYLERRARDPLAALPPGWRELRAGRAGEVGYHLFAV